MATIDEYLNKVTCIDCLELMDALPPQSVSAIVTDLPYGTTACSWDTIIPFEPLWQGVKRVLKPRGVFVTTASQPFTSALVMSNMKWFKYCWYWEKPKGANFALTGFQPLKVIEEVVIFSEGASTFTVNGEAMPYYPQLTPMKKPYTRDFTDNKRESLTAPLRNAKRDKIDYSFNTPRNLIYASQIGDERVHPTQKPIALYEYLIRTYTQPGELVLDFCAGSGTTGLAARNCGRQYILGDTSAEYCAIAEDRLRMPFEPKAVKADNNVNDLPLFRAALEANG